MPSFRVSVTRPLDLDRFTDRLAMAALFAFGAAGYLWGGWAEAVRSGLAAYLSWALCREIDPDHPVTANLAAVAAAAMVLSYARLDLYKRSRVAMGVAAAAALATVIARVAGEGAPAGPWWMYLLIVGGLVSGAALSFVRTAVVSPTDRAEHPIPAERVETARLLAAAFLILSWASGSDSLAASIEPAAPLWAVLILVGGREAVHRAGRRTPGNAP